MTSGPILPMYMTTIKISLLNGRREGVIPRDRPTVPKAEIISNNTAFKLSSGSTSKIKKVAVKIKAMARRTRVKALIRSSSLIPLEKILGIS